MNLCLHSFLVGLGISSLPLCCSVKFLAEVRVLYCIPASFPSFTQFFNVVFDDFLIFNETYASLVSKILQNKMASRTGRERSSRSAVNRTLLLSVKRRTQ